MSFPSLGPKQKEFVDLYYLSFVAALSFVDECTSSHRAILYQISERIKTFFSLFSFEACAVNDCVDIWMWDFENLHRTLAQAFVLLQYNREKKTQQKDAISRSCNDSQSFLIENRKISSFFASLSIWSSSKKESQFEHEWTNYGTNSFTIERVKKMKQTNAILTRIAWQCNANI